MAALRQLSSAAEVQTYLQDNAKRSCLLTFSAHWCGPCKASKPQLEQLAEELKSLMPFAITYEDDLQDYIHTFNIKAFPTYVVYTNGTEAQRVEGVNMDGIRAMVQQYGRRCPKLEATH